MIKETGKAPIEEFSPAKPAPTRPVEGTMQTITKNQFWYELGLRASGGVKSAAEDLVKRMKEAQ